MPHPKSAKDKHKAILPHASSERGKAEQDAEQDEEGCNGEGTTDSRAAEKIVELERALAVAKEEHNITREELAKVRDHAVVYRQRMEKDRRQLVAPCTHTHSSPEAFHAHSRPTSPHPHRSDLMDLDREQEGKTRCSFNHHRDDPRDQNSGLRSELAHLQDQSMSHEAPSQSPTRSEAEWNELTSRLHAAEKELQDRLQQLLSLKSSISSLTRMESQVTDSELAEALSRIANRVREWVIGNFRRTKFDFSNIPPDTERALRAISPSYYNINPTDRLALYQALISSAMMHIFHESVVVGLPEAGPLAATRDLATYMHDMGAEYREWLQNTIRCLEKGKAKYTLQDERKRLTHRLANEIGRRLFALTSVNVAANAQTVLEGILYEAADLQNTLLLQKAQYKVHFFHEQDGEKPRFDDIRMESINDLDVETDEDGDRIIDRVFAFCVFPCLEKFGDEHGQNAEARNVLLKASVCCGIG